MPTFRLLSARPNRNAFYEHAPARARVAQAVLADGALSSSEAAVQLGLVVHRYKTMGQAEQEGVFDQENGPAMQSFVKALYTRLRLMVRDISNSLPLPGQDAACMCQERHCQCLHAPYQSILQHVLLLQQHSLPRKLAWRCFRPPFPSSMRTLMASAKHWSGRY
jgi:hypothetical protein